MQNTTAPFRADEVGSLLRTAPLKDARAKREKGQITPDQLKSGRGRGDQEDHQRSRRRWACSSPPTASSAAPGGISTSSGTSTGCERVVLDHGIQFHGIQTKPESLKVTGKLDFPADHPMLEHFKFLKANTKVTPKMTIPSPSVMHFRGGRQAISQAGLSRDGRLLRRPRQALRQGHQGVLRRRLPLPAARRHGVGLSVLQGAAGPRRAPAARTPTSSPASTPRSSTRR